MRRVGGAASVVGTGWPPAGALGGARPGWRRQKVFYFSYPSASLAALLSVVTFSGTPGDGSPWSETAPSFSLLWRNKNCTFCTQRLFLQRTPVCRFPSVR